MFSFNMLKFSHRSIIASNILVRPHSSIELHAGLFPTASGIRFSLQSPSSSHPSFLQPLSIDGCPQGHWQILLLYAIHPNPFAPAPQPVLDHKMASRIKVGLHRNLAQPATQIRRDPDQLLLLLMLRAHHQFHIVLQIYLGLGALSHHAMHNLSCGIHLDTCKDFTRKRSQVKPDAHATYAHTILPNLAGQVLQPRHEPAPLAFRPRLLPQRQPKPVWEPLRDEPIRGLADVKRNGGDLVRARGRVVHLAHNKIPAAVAEDVHVAGAGEGAGARHALQAVDVAAGEREARLGPGLVEENLAVVAA